MVNKTATTEPLDIFECKWEHYHKNKRGLKMKVYECVCLAPASPKQTHTDTHTQPLCVPLYWQWTTGSGFTYTLMCRVLHSSCLAGGNCTLNYDQPWISAVPYSCIMNRQLKSQLRLLGNKGTENRLGQSAAAKSQQSSPQGHRAPKMRPDLSLHHQLHELKSIRCQRVVQRRIGESWQMVWWFVFLWSPG